VRRRSRIEVLDPDPGDSRLTGVGFEPGVWADRGTLTIAVRRVGDAPLLTGTVHERLRPAGADHWALRLQVPRLERAAVEYQVVDPAGADAGRTDVWRGPKAPPAAERVSVDVAPPEAIGTSAIATTHPVRLWAPPNPETVVVCADGEGLEAWAAVVAASGRPIALVGIVSSGIPVGDGSTYDIHADPRARAYLAHVDQAYFDAHMRYSIDDVLPWVDARLGRLPRLAFGVSNGAAWAAAAGALHPREFHGVLAFSLGAPPARPPRRSGPAHALVVGRFERGFHEATTGYAWRLRARGVRVRLRRPMRGHDHTMWEDELMPALRWLLRAEAR
jgi:hypothetical protein